MTNDYAAPTIKLPTLYLSDSRNVERAGERHFSPPWSAEPQPNYHVVRDANKQQLAYVYFENEPGRRSAAKLLTKDEARRIAARGSMNMRARCWAAQLRQF